MDQKIAIQGTALSIREALFTDLEVVLHHRRSMFSDMGYRMDAIEKAMSASRPFFADRLSDGRFRAWLVEDERHQVVAGGGIIVSDHHASPTDPSPRRPIIVNVYTEPPYRRRGIARSLMELMIRWCREQGFGSIVLHASQYGRPLYEELGFQATNEMRLILK